MADKIATAATALSYSASGSAITFGTLTTNEIAQVTGATFAGLTFAVNWYYRSKHLKLAIEQGQAIDEKNTG